eukprot:2919097-Prymnesium_polylepis.1
MCRYGRYGTRTHARTHASQREEARGVLEERDRVRQTRGQLTYGRYGTRTHASQRRRVGCGGVGTCPPL